MTAMVLGSAIAGVHMRGWGCHAGLNMTNQSPPDYPNDQRTVPFRSGSPSRDLSMIFRLIYC